MAHGGPLGEKRIYILELSYTKYIFPTHQFLVNAVVSDEDESHCGEGGV